MRSSTQLIDATAAWSRPNHNMAAARHQILARLHGFAKCYTRGATGGGGGRLREWYCKRFRTRVRRMTVAVPLAAFSPEVARRCKVPFPQLVDHGGLTKTRPGCLLCLWNDRDVYKKHDCHEPKGAAETSRQQPCVASERTPTPKATKCSQGDSESWNRYRKQIGHSEWCVPRHFWGCYFDVDLECDWKTVTINGKLEL